MANSKNANVVYKIDHIETTDFATAKTASTNVTKELFGTIESKVFSLSYVSNVIRDCVAEKKAHFEFFVYSVLAINADDYSNADDSKKSGMILKGIISAYPYKNENGKLLEIVNFTKGIKTAKVITNFSKKVLDILFTKYLTNGYDYTIGCKFFSLDKKGNVTPIDSAKAESEKTTNETAKTEKRETAKAEISANGRKLAELAELAKEFNKCSKLAEYSAIRDKFNEILNS